METFDLTQTGAQVQDILDKAAQLPSKATLDTELNAKADKSNTYTKAEVDQLVQTLENGSYERVDTYEDLGDPTEEKAGIIWLVGAEDAEEFERYIVGHNGDNLEWVYMGTTAVDLTGKADKVADAVDGDLAGLDSDGNPTDSGYKPADFATAEQGDKADSAYQLPGSGIPVEDLSTPVQNALGRIDNKADKVGSGHTDKLATFNSAGNLKDSGIGVEDVALKASSNPAMLVGSALGIMCNTPQAALFTHRAVPAGAGSGAAQMRLLRGKSIVWNQLVQNGDFSDGTTGWTLSDPGVVSVSNNLASFIRKGNANYISAPVSLIAGHKYFITLDIKALNVSSLVMLVSQNADMTTPTGVINASSAGHYSVIFTPSSSYGYIGFRGGYDSVELDAQIASFTGIQVIDLTQLTMPDLTAPAFEAIYPGFHGFNAGTIKNLTATGIKTKDADNNDLYTMPLPITTMTGKAGGVGESVVIYPDGMMSAGTAFDYGRIDADGWWRKTQKVLGIVNLGNMSWHKGAASTSALDIWISDNDTISKLLGSTNTICSEFIFGGNISTQQQALSYGDNTYSFYSIAAGQNVVNIVQAAGRYADENAFKAAMDGVYLIFELATPIEYTLDTNIYMGYPVDADGTETMLPDQTGLIEPSSSPIDYDVIYPIDLSGNLATELNAMLTANSLAGSFAKNGNGGVTYSAE